MRLKAMLSFALAVGGPMLVVAAVPAYQLAVSESASTMTYGDPSPIFSATLVPPAGDPGSTVANNFYIAVDSTSYAGTVAVQGSTYTLTVRGVSGLLPGQHTVTARYISPNYGVLTSAPATLTVLKAAVSDLQCNLTNPQTITPSAPLTMSIWSTLTSGTASLTFTGPETYTSPAAQLNGSGQFAATAPASPGVYQVTCNFSGNSLYDAVSQPLYSRQLTVTASNQIGGISLYTNPAPLVYNAPTTWRVIVAGRSGLPAPTGYVSLRIGSAFTKILPLGADGSLTFEATCPGFGPTDSIQVAYQGDSVYGSSTAYFPVNTSPIPGTASSHSTAPGSQATPPTGSPGAAPASQDPTSPSPVTSPTTLPSLIPAVTKVLGTGSTTTGWIARVVGAAVVLLALLGLGAGLLVYRRRRETSSRS